MNKKLPCFILFTVLLCLNFSLKAQSFKIIGKITDAETKAPLAGVYVSLANLKDSSTFLTVTTNQGGNFTINDLPLHVKYTLRASYISYSEISFPVEGKGKVLDLGTISMSIKSNHIGEVVFQGTVPSARQKGDTTEMNTSGYVTVRDASAQELVRKMPGITIENGTVRAHGEDVKKVLVDGKEFFGEDASTALNNLPAEIIEKVQIFDRLSEQAQFSGFDDGQSSKTINIVTKQNRKNGEFGKFYAGSNLNDRYQAGGNLNIFNKKRRISFLGLVNNINQQNFSQQDLLGVTSANGKHDGGFTIGSQNGANITRSTGVNYSENWGKKVLVTGSYFFNSMSNATQQSINKDKFLFPKPDHFGKENDVYQSLKSVHRFHNRIEYDIDSLNTLISTTKLSFQSNNATNVMGKKTTKSGDVFVNSIHSNNHDVSDNFNVTNELVFRHKFNKPKRTISFNFTTLVYGKESNSDQVGELLTTLKDSIPTNQHQHGENGSYFFSSNTVYTEPLSSISMLSFELDNDFTNNRRNRETFDMDDHFQILNRLDSFTNNFRNNYFNNHIGLDYRIKTENIKFSIGSDYQHSFMTEYEIYPKSLRVNRVFTNFLPNLQFSIKNGKNNLKLLYRTSTNAPSISQLQNVIDNSDRTNLITGNLWLKQEYNHKVTCNYSFANPETSISSTLVFTGMITKNFVGSQVIVASRDTFVSDANINLLKNMQLTRPVNFDHAVNLRVFYNFCFPIKPIRCKLNMTSGLNYSETPGYVNQYLNRYNLYSATQGFMLSSYISENIDFTVSYNFNYSIVKNSMAVGQTNLNPTYIYQSGGAKITWVTWKGFVINNEILGQTDRGFQFYNQKYVLWNAYLGKRLFHDNGELKISVFDLLNRNINISHSVSPQSIQDINTNVLHRYGMLTFTYNLRNFHGMDQPQKSKKNKKSKNKN
jgi:hypothetical protein